MVAEEEDRVGIEDFRVGPQLLFEEDGGHRGHVLVREADVGAEEAGLAGFGPVGADAPLGGVHDPLPREDFLAEGHGAGGGGRSAPVAGGGAWAFGCSVGTAARGFRPRHRQRRLPLQPRHVELEESAVFDDLPRDVVGPGGEFGQRDRLAGTDPVDKAEIGGGQNAQVLAVLVVDALDALADDHPDSGHQLGVGALLAAGPFPAPLPRDRTNETTRLHGAALDGRFGSPVPARDLQPQVGEFAQRLVVEEADVRRGDLVGADLVAQQGLQFGRQLRVQTLVELPPDQVGVVREEEDAAAEGDFGGPFLDFGDAGPGLSATIAPKWRTNTGCLRPVAHRHLPSAAWRRSKPGAEAVIS